MSAPPSRSGSPRWSVLLRVGVGAGVFGLFVQLFAFRGSPIGLGLLAIGAACVLAALVFYLQDRPPRR